MAAGTGRLMELAARIAQIIIPVLLIVTVGYFYGRHARPELSGFNRVVLDVLSPLLTYSALASRDFRLQDHAALLAGGGRWPAPPAPSRARWCRW